MLFTMKPCVLLAAFFASASAARLNWGNCSTIATGLQCTTLEVPLDWSNPRKGKTTLGIMRLKALNSTQRIGSLFYNPGGPGGSASSYVELQAVGLPLFSSDTVKHFDLIAMDPRGIGLSSPIQCNQTIWNERLTFFPKTEAEFQTLVAHNKAFGQSCIDLTGPLVGFMDTASVAKDMEAVRLALNDGKLNYLGLSYGTQIGAQYAELFPNSIRVMALDGILDHSGSDTNRLAVEAAAAEDAFNRFAVWCSETTTCALYGKNVTDLWTTLISKANTEPIPAPGCSTGRCRRNVTGEDILFGLQAQMIFKLPVPAFRGLIGSWIDLGQAIAEGLAGDATKLSPYVPQLSDSGNFGGLAVECLDWTYKSANSLSKLKYKAQLNELTAPLTKGATQSYMIQAGCLGWPLPVTNPTRTMDIKAKAPLLLVNSNHDSETSYVWANNLLEQISSEAVLLTRDGDAHVSYFLKGDTTKAIDTYLATGVLPPANTVLYS